MTGNLFNTRAKLQQLEHSLRLTQLRSMLQDLDKELYKLQDVVAEAKRLLEEQAK